MPPFNLGDLSQQKASVGCKPWSLTKSKQLKLGKPFRITMHLLCIYKSFCKEQKDEQGLSYSTEKRPTEWNFNMNLLKFKDGHVISSQWEHNLSHETWLCKTCLYVWEMSNHWRVIFSKVEDWILSISHLAAWTCLGFSPVHYFHFRRNESLHFS